MAIKALFLTVTLLATPALAQDVARCSDSKGQAFYPFAGLIPKDKSGWREDGVTKGRITVKRLSNDEYDLIFTDTQRPDVSSRADGGIVLMARAASQDFSLIIVYPGSTTEIYSFWKASDGRLQYSHLQNKAGIAPIPKSSALVGQCEFINFSLAIK